MKQINHFCEKHANDKKTGSEADKLPNLFFS